MRVGVSFRAWSLMVVAGALLGLASAPAPAQTAISWRQTSVLAERVMEGQQMVMVRRGVAIFAAGEPATLTVRLMPSGRPADGRMIVRHEFVFRFEDGSTLTTRGQGTIAVNADGSSIPGEGVLNGDFVSGTGRFAGAAGSYTMRSRTDVSARTDGVLGDYFGAGEGKVTLSR